MSAFQRLQAPRISPPTRQGLQRAMLLFRWLNWFWISAIFAWEVYAHNIAESEFSGEPVAHPFAGVALLVAALAITAGLTELYQRDPLHLLRPPVVIAEILVAASMLFADEWVYGFALHSQTLPSMWVIAAVVATALAAGQTSAMITGIGLGVSRYVGWLLFAERNSDASSVSRLTTIVLLGMTGWVAGYVLNKLEEADRSISIYRAREEVGRTLHDGVLQTLAVIQRRSKDNQLVELARSQELELREYLFDVSNQTATAPAPSGAAIAETDLAAGLRATARKAEQRYQLRVQVVTAPDLQNPEPPVIAAICGAVSEAITNAAKHGEASNVTVYAEPANDDEDQVEVSVKDNGSGFDERTVSKGQGLTNSIERRITEVGGTTRIFGRPGRGTEIRIQT